MMSQLSFANVHMCKWLARFLLVGCFCLVGIPTAVLAQQNPADKEAAIQQLVGCWNKVDKPASQLCFDAGGKLFFINTKTDKTIRRKWKMLPDGLLRLKFIFFFRPTYRIQNLSATYVKLVPVKKGVSIELERQK